MISQASYELHGFKDRMEYLESLAYDYGICLADVLIMADMLGPSEDFDGLIMMIEDYVS